MRDSVNWHRAALAIQLVSNEQVDRLIIKLLVLYRSCFHAIHVSLYSAAQFNSDLHIDHVSSFTSCTGHLLRLMAVLVVLAFEIVLHIGKCPPVDGILALELVHPHLI
jgi:hypothetical protein